MRFDLSLAMEKPQAVVQLDSANEYRNRPPALSREKEYVAADLVIAAEEG